MSTELVTIEPSANLTEAVHAMSAGRSGSVLVLQAGSLVGIFTERDILRALAHSAKADLARISLVTQWMSRDPVTIRPDTTVAEALNQMLFGGFRHLPVMDGDAVVGMVVLALEEHDVAEEVMHGQALGGGREFLLRELETRDEHVRANHPQPEGASDPPDAYIRSVVE